MDISTFLTGSSKKIIAGYTFIEMVVTVTIIIVISTVAIGYSSSIGKQMLLLRTQAQLVALFSNAKSLTQNFRLTPPAGKRICSYGVHVERSGANTGEVFVFQDLVPTGSACSTANNAYSPSDPTERLTGELNNFRIDTKSLVFATSSDALSPDLVDIVFIPPNVDVLINNNSSVNSGSVVVQIIGTSNRFDLRINRFAQITI